MRAKQLTAFRNAVAEKKLRSATDAYEGIQKQDGDTDQSSDDDISYGSDSSSIDGDSQLDILCSFTEEESLFSDEEVFSEDDFDYDLGTTEFSTYGEHPFDFNIKESPYPDESGFTCNPEDAETMEFAMIENEELFTIVEESESLQFHPKESEGNGLSSNEDGCDRDYLSYHRNIIKEDETTALSVEVTFALYPISEEPELEEEYSRQQQNDIPQPTAKQRTSLNLTETTEDSKLDDKEGSPDLDTIISNLDVTDNHYRKFFSGSTSIQIASSLWRRRSKKKESASSENKSQATKDYDRIHTSFGLSFLRLGHKFPLR